MDTLIASPAPRVIPTRSARRWLLPVAATALVAVAAGAGLVIGRHSALPLADPPPASTTAAPETATGAPPQADGTPADATKTPARPAKPAPRQGTTADRPVVGASPALDTRPARAEAVCAHCGVVESVTAEARQGEGSGVGAVAGGVVGGLLGNQVGKGNGRTAMTVIGAIGGGMAGNAIEKQQRSRTVYVVKVRMDDGTLRSFTRSEPWSVGQRVTVDGNALQARAATAAPARDRMLQTGGQGLSS